MNRHAIRHLPVVDGNELVGILANGELVVIESIPGLHPASIEVARVMGSALSVSENMPVDEALELMTEHRVDCVVVRGDKGAVIGIFTAVDALAAMASILRGAA